jgi:hypothetical protein
MLLYRHPPKTVYHPLFEHRIFSVTDSEKTKWINRIHNLLKEFELVLKKQGTGKEWLLADIPEKDVLFTRDIRHIVKGRSTDNLYRERDPIKVISKLGKPSLLVERENTLMKHLSTFVNFVPRVYANHSAIELLRSRKLIE